MAARTTNTAKTLEPLDEVARLLALTLKRERGLNEVIVELREKLGGVSHQAISQRRARLQRIVQMPTDIATYVLAAREGVRLHTELDAATLEQVATFEDRLRSREEGANGSPS